MIENGYYLNNNSPQFEFGGNLHIAVRIWGRWGEGGAADVQ